jgi:hypothetical protein
MTKQDELLVHIAGLMQVRAWQDKHLPIEFSLLAYDLLICACFHTLSGTPLNYKQLFLTLPYSKNGIRKQLSKFIANEWLEICTDTYDRRVRYVVALPKLLDVLKDYLELRKIHYCGTGGVLVIDQGSSVKYN